MLSFDSYNLFLVNNNGESEDVRKKRINIRGTNLSVAKQSLIVMKNKNHEIESVFIVCSCAEIRVYDYQTKYAAISGTVHVAGVRKICQRLHRIRATGQSTQYGKS